MLLRGKLFAGALFAGALFGATESPQPPSPPQPPTSSAGSGGFGYHPIPRVARNRIFRQYENNEVDDEIVFLIAMLEQESLL